MENLCDSNSVSANEMVKQKRSRHSISQQGCPDYWGSFGCHPKAFGLRSVISCSISVRTEHTSEVMLELIEHSQQALKNRTSSGIPQRHQDTLCYRSEMVCGVWRYNMRIKNGLDNRAWELVYRSEYREGKSGGSWGDPEKWWRKADTPVEGVVAWKPVGYIVL